MSHQLVGLVAGEGIMPKAVLESMRAQGERVFLICIRGVTAPELIPLAEAHLWIALTQLGKAIRACRKQQVAEVTFAGRVPHRAIYSIRPWRLDWTSIRLWFSLPDKKGDTILTAIADTFQKKGITIMDSTHYLKEQLAKKGVLTKTQPSKAALEDIAIGIEVAKELGKLGVGQTVVIKSKAIVAVEAMEGTDQCLERAGQVAGRGCVVVKLPKPNHDMRFDVPVIGLNTIQKLAKIGATTLAIEAGRVLLIEAEVVPAADQFGIAIIGLTREETENKSV